MTLLLVALGAAVGAMIRYLAGHFVDGGFPRGTLLVNITGSFVLGWLGGHAVDGLCLALVGTGFCGGLTTYSSFAVQGVNAGRRVGTAYVLATMLGCLAAAALGFSLVE